MRIILCQSRCEEISCDLIAWFGPFSGISQPRNFGKSNLPIAHKNVREITKILQSYHYFNLSNPSSTIGAMNFQSGNFFLAHLVH